MAQTNNSSDTITLRPISVVKFLGFAAGSLLLIHIVLQFMYHVLGVQVMDTLRGRFDVDNEISIPTWFSQLLLLIPGVLALVIFRLEHHHNRIISIYWLLLGALFLFLSLDEGAMLHEAFITKFREQTVDTGATGWAIHTWLIPIGGILLLLMVPFVRFVRHLPKRTAVLLAIGLSIFVFGAIIYETLGLIYAHPGFWYQGLNVAIEEGLEMTGAIVVIYTLLDYLKKEPGTIKLKLH